MPRFVVDWTSWIVGSLLIFFDSVGTTILFALPLYFFDSKHFLEKGSWVSLGCAVGLVAMKTIAAALFDFKKFVRKLED